MADRQDEMVELLAAHYLAALRYEEEFASADSERLRDLRAKTYAYARRAAARADAVANKESAARWYGVAVEQARALDLPALERAALAIEYDDAAGGHEPHETIRRDRRGGAAAGRAGAAGHARRGLAQVEATIRDELAFYRYVGERPGRCPRGPARRPRQARGRSADLGARGASGAARLDLLAGRAAGGGAGHPASGHRGRPGLRCRRHGADGDARPRHRAGHARRPEGVGRARSCGAWSSPARPTIACCWGAATSTCRRIMLGNGELAADILPIMAEGLERTRRSLDHTATSWIVQNRADLLTMVGRLPEAMADAEEALAEARLIGEPGRIQGCLGERAWVRLHVGDRAGRHRRPRGGPDHRGSRPNRRRSSTKP